MADNIKTLTGKWAVVTGSSSGIGRAIALELANAGANIIIHGNQKADQAEQLAEEIRQTGCIVQVLIQNFAEHGFCEDFVERVWQTAPVDIWVNNAGLDVLTGEAEAWPFGQKLSELWAVDVNSTIQLSRSVGSRMKKIGRGVILNVGWDQAETGMGGDSGEMFAATKGAIMSFTRSLAKSLAPEVRVNCIAPGWIKTDWGNAAPEYWQKRATDESLLQRWGTPKDIAKASKFLVSPESSFITGQILNVNGGRA